MSGASRVPISFAWLAAAAVAAAACGYQRPVDPDSDDNSEFAGTGPDADSNPSGPDGTSSGDGSSGSSDLPDRITTRNGASFRGVLKAKQRSAVELEANADDVVIMRLRQVDGSALRPALFLFKSGKSGDRSRVRWHNPRNNNDAHIPYKDGQIDSGFTFPASTTYDLELANHADRAGSFRFELRCIGGPCKSNDTNDDNDQDNNQNSGSDSDGVSTSDDNCPSTGNPNQANRDHDLWGDACDPNPSSIDCPSSSLSNPERRIRAAYADHTTLTYYNARDRMFTNIENSGGTVETVYTGEQFQTNSIPDPAKYNTEHTWPQSKMQSDSPPTTSDLHILFPAADAANTERSNLPFDVVTGYTEWSSNGSKRGENDRGWLVFEPRDSRKGDIARALFYYAVVYNRDIDISAESDGWGTGTGEEKTLRKWHNSTDPVSSREKNRNGAIEQAQNNRNPFVDCPGLVGQISDF